MATTHALDRGTGRAALSPTRWLLPVILLGNVLNVADVFVVNVALPTLSRTLHANSAELELVSAAYTVAYACFLVLGGRLGDTFGRRRLFMTGMAGFTIASAACGLAPSSTTLIVARAVQGVTAAMMVPQVLATIQVVYQGQARQRALGIFGAIMGTAAALAQILGGVLVQADIFGSSWRPAFLINVPVGIAGLLLARRIVPETRSPHATSIDLPGTVLLGAAVIMLLIPLAVGRDENWPVWGWVMLGAAPVSAIAFGAVQLRKERRGVLPLLPPALLRSRGFLPGLFFAVAGFSVFGGFMLTISIAFQFGRHFGPIEAGFALTPYALAWLVASLLTRNLAARFGRNLIIFGAVGMAVGFGILAVQAHQGFASMTGIDFAPALVVIGFCQALAVIPALSITLSAVPPERAGVAAGAFATVQQSSVALGTAGLGTLFFTLAADHGYGSALTTAEIVQAAGALLSAVVALGMPKGR